MIGRDKFPTRAAISGTHVKAFTHLTRIAFLIEERCKHLRESYNSGMDRFMLNYDLKEGFKHGKLACIHKAKWKCCSL
jgi:hypothetical protein